VRIVTVVFIKESVEAVYKVVYKVALKMYGTLGENAKEFISLVR